MNAPHRDDDLMQQAARGSHEAFRRIVVAHQGPLLRVARRLLSDDAARAEDVVQEAFLRLWRGRLRYRGEGNLRGFLLRIVRNLCRDEVTGAKEPVALDAERDAAPDDCAAGILRRDLAEAVRDALARLPESQRAVFVLSHYEQMSYAEIADALGCPPGTVASRKHLAVAALRRHLRPWFEEKTP